MIHYLMYRITRALAFHALYHSRTLMMHPLIKVVTGALLGGILVWFFFFRKRNKKDSD